MRLTGFAAQAGELSTPNDVLDALDAATCALLPLHVLCAARFPLKVGDWSAVKVGETVFLHKSAPREWWQEYPAYAQTSLDPGIMMARMSLGPYTWTESQKMVEPIGADRWPMELAMKHGMRDGIVCPIGGRWVLSLWSRKVLTPEVLPVEARALVFMAVCFALMRVEALLQPDPGRIPARARLTARETAVVRLAAAGRDVKEMAAALGLGEETIRTHLRKAKEKLGARNRAQAVAEALRQQLLA